jgi:tRNA(Ile)-lysidine synthase
VLERCTFPSPGTSLTCAVSGGPDSLALLALAVAAGCQAHAVHVDHGLRPGSGDEALIVATVAAHLGATFESVRVQVAPGPNLEARARAARYATLPADVATGHTADDQAETILLALLRGSGTRGLAGMRAGDAGGVRRPLLALRRAETAAIAAEVATAAGTTVVHDPTNRDPRHRRNRVRAEVLPLLGDVAERDLVPLLVRQAELIADDDDLLDHLAAALDPTDAIALAAAPVALARRAVRRWLTREHPPDARSVERVLEVARGAAVACEVPGLGRVARTGQRLRIEPPRDDGRRGALE